MKLILGLAFFLTAALYASVGFGGGSTYTALLAVSGTSYIVIPIISLLCNICVVSGSSWRYLRRKVIKLSEVWPLFILSIPAAFIGGMVNVSEVIFIGLLSVALLLASIRMVFGRIHDDKSVSLATKRNRIVSALIGGAIGFYSGIVGIGGGIFLAPILYRMCWGRAQQIAAACSIFILVNSMAGLVGQITKTADLNLNSDILSYWPLILAVLFGGTIGNMLSLRLLTPKLLRRITGILILIVAIRLLIKWMTLSSFT